MFQKMALYQYINVCKVCSYFTILDVGADTEGPACGDETGLTSCCKKSRIQVKTLPIQIHYEECKIIYLCFYLRADG